MRINRYKLLIQLFIFGSGLIFFALPAQAVDLTGNIMDQVTAGATSGGLGTTNDPQIIVALVIQGILGLFATVFMVLMVMSGYWFLTARGEADKEEKAMDTIRRAATGLLVVLMSFAIVRFVSLRAQRSALHDPTVPQSDAVERAADINRRQQEEDSRSRVLY